MIIISIIIHFCSSSAPSLSSVSADLGIGLWYLSFANLYLGLGLPFSYSSDPWSLSLHLTLSSPFWILLSLYYSLIIYPFFFYSKDLSLLKNESYELPFSLFSFLSFIAQLCFSDYWYPGCVLVVSSCSLTIPLWLDVLILYFGWF